MNVDLGIWHKLTRLIVVLLFLATVLGVALWYKPLIRHNEHWRKRELELDKEIRAQLQTNDQLKASINAMQDPRTVERLAREKLGYAKTNETVIRFEAPTDAEVSIRPP